MVVFLLIVSFRVVGFGFLWVGGFCLGSLFFVGFWCCVYLCFRVGCLILILMFCVLVLVDWSLTWVCGLFIGLVCLGWFVFALVCGLMLVWTWVLMLICGYFGFGLILVCLVCEFLGFADLLIWLFVGLRVWV